MTNLLVMHLGSRGAGPRMMYEFSRAASRRPDVEVTLAHFAGNELADELDALGLPQCKARGARLRGRLGLMARVISNVTYAFALLRFARRHQVQAVYAVMDNPLQVLPTMLLRMSGIPVLGSAHDADRHLGEENVFMEAVMQMRPRVYSGLMTYSKAVASLMRERVPHPERVFQTVHGSYGTPGRAPVPRSLPSGPVHIGFFGRILRYKGLDRLAEAVVRLRAQGRDVQLVVQGRGEIPADLAELLDEAGAVVDNRWIEEEDVEPTIAGFDVLAVPYEEASQSGVIGYAMNAGVPVVVTPLEGLVEQVADSQVGLVAEDMSPEAFAAALDRLITDEDLYRSISERGPEIATTEFGWDRVVDDILAAIAKLRPDTSGRPRVLLLSKGLGLGGSERLLVDEVMALGKEVDWTVGYVRTPSDHFVEQLRAAGAEVVPLRPDGSRLPWPLRLAALLRRVRPHVVHAHSPLPGSVSRLLVRSGLAGRGAVCMYTEHNTWGAYLRPTRYLNALTIALNSRIWAVSEEARLSVRPRWLNRRVTTLHHGIDIEATRKAATRPTELPPGAEDPSTFVFVNVANRRRSKAHDVLLAAFDLACAEEPDLRLWLAGRNVDAPDFVEMVNSRSAADRISVLGVRADAPALMAAADSGVLSSDFEGLPVVVMEFLALGKPVVSTSVGGIPEAIRDGEEALLVPPREPAMLAAAMVRLKRDPVLYEELSRKAAARAERFDSRQVHRLQLQAYQDAAAGRAAPARSR